MNVRFYYDVHATDAVEWYFEVFVLSPIAHARHICAVGLVLLVAWGWSAYVALPIWRRPLTRTFCEHDVSI